MLLLYDQALTSLSAHENQLKKWLCFYCYCCFGCDWCCYEGVCSNWSWLYCEVQGWFGEVFVRLVRDRQGIGVSSQKGLLIVGSEKHHAYTWVHQKNLILAFPESRTWVPKHRCQIIAIWNGKAILFVKRPSRNLVMFLDDGLQKHFSLKYFNLLKENDLMFSVVSVQFVGCEAVFNCWEFWIFLTLLF